MLSFVPLYYGDRLDVVNPEGDVGLITLWTPIHTARKFLEANAPHLLAPDSRIAVISNLYGDGMHQMLCNLLYNPQIRHLVSFGNQREQPTVRELRNFLELGVERAEMLGVEVMRVPGTNRMFPALEGFDVESLRARGFTYLGPLSDPDAVANIGDLIDDLPRSGPFEEASRIKVDIPAGLTSDTAYRPSDILSHQVSRPRPLDCWEELVTRTMRFGHPVRLRSGQRLELLNARVVIRDPADDSQEALEEYGFSLEQLHTYQESMFEPRLLDDIEYTYGNRLNGYFQHADAALDSIATAGKMLAENPESRNAFISLWDTPTDLAADRSTPCLVTIFFRRVAGRLTLTATYRSHNLLTAWLQNAYGLMAVQKRVADLSGIPIGAMTIISHSLGIDPLAPRFILAKGISNSWDRDEDRDFETRRRENLRADPNGYFVVSVEGGEIVAEHRFEGMLIKKYAARNAAMVQRQIDADMAVTLPSHAMWLGRELQVHEHEMRRLRAGPKQTDIEAGA